MEVGQKVLSCTISQCPRLTIPHLMHLMDGVCGRSSHRLVHVCGYNSRYVTILVRL